METSKRIWVFVAYRNVIDNEKYGTIPYFSKLFDDHGDMKEFSGKHSAMEKSLTPGYHSTYFDLTDQSNVVVNFTEDGNKT
jgi:hypothetical protein